MHCASLYYRYLMVFQFIPDWRLSRYVSAAVQTTASSLHQNIYCDFETFAPSCSTGEVILVNEARYGRMNISRCIPDDHKMGCSIDVMPFIDSQCSGRQTCSLGIITLYNYANSCNASGQQKNLNASFICLKVTVAAESQCRNSTLISLYEAGSHGYIASHISEQIKCRNSSHAWILTALKGQKIKISLLDFNYHLFKANENFSYPLYASITDGSIPPYDVYGGKPTKVSLVVTSVTNVIEIRLRNHVHQNNNYFLLKYEVVGCPDPDLSMKTVLKIDENEATVGCKYGPSQTTWVLKCVQGKWLGDTGTCNSATINGSESTENSESKVPNYNAVYIITGFTGFTVCVLLLISLGVIYLKRTGNLSYCHRSSLPLSDAPDTNYGQTTIHTLPSPPPYSAQSWRFEPKYATAKINEKRTYSTNALRTFNTVGRYQTVETNAYASTNIIGSVYDGSRQQQNTCEPAYLELDPCYTQTNFK